VQSASDLGFAAGRTVELSYLVSVEGRRCRPTQALAILAGMRQADATGNRETYQERHLGPHSCTATVNSHAAGA
jgi:hypothetical protein